MQNKLSAKIAFLVTTLTVVSFLTDYLSKWLADFGLLSVMGFSIQINEEHGLVAVVLSDGNGTSAEIYSLGGILNRYSIPVKGHSCNLVAGFNSLAESREKIGESFQGARLSPFVCRMRNGTYTWLGVTYHIEKKYLGAHAIHGLMYDSVYTVVETKSDVQSATVVLEGSYDGSDPGYPFPYQVRLEWVLRKGSNLTVTSTIWHDNEEMIPLAEGWHPYFSLGGKTDEWELQFNTNRQMEYDADLLPTGKLIADDRFVSGCLLEGIHLDNGFVWPDAEDQSTARALHWKISAAHPTTLTTNFYSFAYRPVNNGNLLQPTEPGRYYDARAITLISTLTPLGNPFTATVSRAGNAAVK
jgi:aldose 1-epimerase